MIVVDTCVLTHLFNETEHTKLAQKILEIDSSWIVPIIWQEEYANVLSKLARREKRGYQEVIGHFEDVLNQLSSCEKYVDNREALKTSLQKKISVYDAHFVTLAQSFDVLLVTEDQEVIKRCSKMAVSMKEFISLLN
ncbi:MAG: type II toxin-antitoxin system VapC family toxin [Waddliaceae bacterium]